MTLLLALLLSLPAAADDWSARVTEVSGSVLIYAEGSDEGLPAEADTPLEDGDRVETGDDGRAELALEAESLMELGPGSSFTVGSTQEADSWFSLTLGSLMAKVKTLSESRRRRFSIRTPTSVCAVRGTEFGVEVEEDGATSVGVFDEGQVGLTAGTDGGEETLLTEQQEATVAPGERTVRARRLERLERRRERMGHLRARREFHRKNWRSIPPERRQELRQKWRAGMRERLKNMSPEQRQKMLKGIQGRRERMQERREGLKEKFQNATPERKREIREKVKERRGERRENRQDRRQERGARGRRR